MKRLYKSIFTLLSAALVVGSLSSCEDYLDKEPSSDVNPEEAFKNYTNFQGFVEEIYDRIPHKTTCYWNTTFNWGEDEILTTSGTSHQITPQMDNGDFKAYYTSWGGNLSFLYGNTNTADPKRMWYHTWNESWYCIRKTNLGLEALEQGLMTDATQEERDFVKGQLLFFRGWWYEELMVWFGGMPYLDHVPDVNDELKEPRLSAQECALKAAEDFKEAAKYLPNDWDKTTIGKVTYGQNELRVTKATSLAYAGKCLLYASSPLYEHGAQLGGSETYSYNKEYAEQAAEELGKSLALIESGETPYSLAEYYDVNDFDALYNHDRKKAGSTCYTDIFYTVKQGFKQPGTVEAMMRGTPFNQANDARWGFACTWGSNINSLFFGSSTQTPTANYVNYAYGMANGLPLNDPESGFDPTHPFKNRDPRFYHDIVFDGEMYINNTPSEKYKDQKYATLFTNGLMRDEQNGSRTGYFCQKLVPHTANQDDRVSDDWGTGFKSYLPYMRVADVYLMYAEAGAAVSGANYKSTTFSKTAEEAINTLRDRVSVGHVNSKFTSSQTKFMDEVRRERACELAFEGFRFNDLQRWLLLTEKPYTIKTSQEFVRVYGDDWYTNVDNDPREAEVSNWHENTLLTRNFGTKHYWFPIVEKEVHIYADFAQNPGW